MLSIENKDILSQESVCGTDLRVCLVRIDLEVGARLLRGQYGSKGILAFLAPGISLSER